MTDEDDLMWPSLRRDPPSDLNIGALRGVINDAENVVQMLNNANMLVAQQQYFSWVRNAQAQLVSVCGLVSASTLLKTNAYWQIRGLGPSDERHIEALQDELRVQAAWLEEFVDHLCSLHSRVMRGSGTVGILDTHLFLHYVPPPSVSWPMVLGSDEVRLVLPLRVVEELDKKQWESSDKVAGRAASALAWLRRIGDVAADPVEVKPGLTIEVHVPGEPRHRPVDADQEILDTTTLFAGLLPDVTLVTGDAAFEMRARASALTVKMLDDRHRRVAPPKDPAFDAL